MYGFVCKQTVSGIMPNPSSCRSSRNSFVQDFVDLQLNFPVPQQSSYRISLPVFSTGTFYLFLSLVGPSLPPPLGLLRVNLDVIYGDIPSLCPQNLLLSSALGTLQILPKYTDNSRCSWFFTSPHANRVFFSVTLRPNSCTAIEVMSPSSGDKWVINGDSTPWSVSYINSSLPLNQKNSNRNIKPLTFANWEGNAVITSYTPFRRPSCQNTDLSEKIELSWQTLFVEDVDSVRTPGNQIMFGNDGVYNLSARMLNVPPVQTSGPVGLQFENNLWLQMSAGQTVTVVAKDTKTGLALNRLSSAPIPLIVVANSRVPSTFDNDFHNWPGIISPVRQQLQEALTITAPSDGTYFFSILGGTILYDEPESIDIFVIKGTGKYENCWDDKLDAIKPRDV
jgi:hypothetical protein